MQEQKQCTIISSKLDKATKVEALHALAVLYLEGDSFKDAKLTKIEAYKVVRNDQSVPESEKKEIKVAIKAIDSILNLHSIDTDSQTSEYLMTHYEKLGDQYSRLSLSEKAVHYYLKVIDIAKEIGKPDDQVSQIYYSIARTYEEDNKLELAQKYYQIECDIQATKSPKEACKTMLGIVEIATQLNSPKEERRKLVQFSIDYADKSNCIALKIRALEYYLELISDEDEKVEVKEKIENLRNQSGSQSESEQDEEQTSESELELDSSEDENFESHTNASDKLRVKFNQFGETDLHIAAAKGNLQRVKYLVKGGHPVNVRDHSGWLPLHEACNHGMIDVVRYLITNGGRRFIDDKGGKDCSGITPLHDSATNGQLEIVEYLVSQGASVIIKNDKGQTPLDSLISFKESANFDEAEMSLIRRTEDIIRDKMAEEGCQVNVSFSNSARRSNGFRGNSSTVHSPPRSISVEKQSSSKSKVSHSSSSLRRSLHIITSEKSNFQSDDSSNDGFNGDFGSPTKTSTQVPKKSAVENYMNVISQLRSAKANSNLMSPKKTTTKTAEQGLILAEEFVAEDNFFIDDVGSKPKKRKRPLQPMLDFTNHNKARKYEGRPRPKKQSKIDEVFKNSSKFRNISPLPTDEQDFIFPDNTSEDFLIDDSSLSPILKSNRNPTLHDHLIRNESPKVLFNSENQSTPAKKDSPPSFKKTCAPTADKNLRLRVIVEDKTLLVPIADTSKQETIQWLAEEVARWADSVDNNCIEILELT